MSQDTNERHEMDDDACCIHCGFDGAEWAWLKRQGCLNDIKQPACHRRQTWAERLSRTGAQETN